MIENDFSVVYPLFINLVYSKEGRLQQSPRLSEFAKAWGNGKVQVNAPLRPPRRYDEIFYFPYNCFTHYR